MCEKQAVDLYHDYLTRIKSEYEIKHKRMAKDTKFQSFEEQLLCLPSKSRAKVKENIQKRQRDDLKTGKSQQGTEPNQKS